jgi:hypothetical protein
MKTILVLSIRFRAGLRLAQTGGTTDRLSVLLPHFTRRLKHNSASETLWFSNFAIQMMGKAQKNNFTYWKQHCIRHQTKQIKDYKVPCKFNYERDDDKDHITRTACFDDRFANPDCNLIPTGLSLMQSELQRFYSICNAFRISNIHHRGSVSTSALLVDDSAV